MKKKILSASLISIFLLSLTGCADQYSGNTYSSSEVKQVQNIRYATVVGLRPVKISKDSSSLNMGSIGGTVLGGFIGNTIGSGSGRLLATAGGAILGGVAGNSINNAAKTYNALEITLREDGAGRDIAIVQSDDVSFQKGERVRIIGSGNSLRVIR